MKKKLSNALRYRVNIQVCWNIKVSAGSSPAREGARHVERRVNHKAARKSKIPGKPIERTASR